jgi:hypothetical protein
MENSHRFKVGIDDLNRRKKIIHKIREGFKRSIFDNKNRIYHLDRD